MPQNASYDTSYTFAHTNATAIAATSSAALADSVTRNARSGADRSRAHTVRVRRAARTAFGWLVDTDHSLICHELSAST
ncbi:MAG: hypothetical protein ACRDPL_17620 [Propionibacteriaceae bacterium]